jgi:hypothetical protein
MLLQLDSSRSDSSVATSVVMESIGFEVVPTFPTAWIWYHQTSGCLQLSRNSQGIYYTCGEEAEAAAGK